MLFDCEETKLNLWPFAAMIEGHFKSEYDNYEKVYPYQRAMSDYKEEM